MVFEVLEKLQAAICRHCGEPITQYRGDLGSVMWCHDSTGRGECPTSTYAEPA